MILNKGDVKMKRKTLRLLLLTILAVTMLTAGCSDTKKPQEDVTLGDKATIERRASMSPKEFYLEENKDVVYQLTTIEEKADDNSWTIKYPQLEDYKDSDLESLINQSFYNIGYLLIYNDADEFSPITVDYEVIRNGENFISILYTSSQNWEGSIQNIKKGITIDLASTNEIAFHSIIKNDDTSLSQFNKVFEKYSKEAGFNYTVVGEWMDFYIIDDSFVFLFRENDHSLDYSTIYVPIDEVTDYLTTDFGNGVY
jgi:hypothetical protein